MMVEEAQAQQEAPARAASGPSLGQVLIDAGQITPAQLEEALTLQSSGDGRRLGNILIEQGWLDPEGLALALSVQLNLPYVDLKRHKVQPETLKLIPEVLARKYILLPIDTVDGNLTVAMSDPTDIQVIQEIEALTRKTVVPAVGVSTGLQASIDLYYKSNRQIEREIAEIAPALEAHDASDGAALAEAVDDDPVVRAVDMILKQALRDRASDIHIEPDHSSVRVRFRVDGILQETLTLPKGSHASILSRIKVLAGMNIAERRRAQDGQFSMTFEDEEVFFRVASSETTWGEMATLRILGRSESILDLPGLGLSPQNIEAISRMLASPFGMMLVCGPTGSGKTTTLYASLNQLDRERMNVLTIEDPVEFDFQRINQIKVNRAADITFASGLRGIMRLDPDVIMVGEIRDGETSDAATQAALTGHLVLSSIHANDAPGALYRLSHLGVERYLLASAMLGIVAQRLVRKICPYCRTQIQLPALEKELIRADLGEDVGAAYIGEGCTYCSHTGYLNRTGIFETMMLSESLRRSFVEGASSDEIRAQAQAQGMVSMKTDGLMKVRQGITTVAEVMRNVVALA